MKRIALLTVVLVAFLAAPAMAGTVEGTVQGLTCVTQGKVCPIDQEDPMIAAEKVFVVLQKDGSFYFVPYPWAVESEDTFSGDKGGFEVTFPC